MARSITSPRRVLVGTCAAFSLAALVAAALLWHRSITRAAGPGRPGYTPLMRAVEAADADEVERLLEAGADANQRTPDGHTMLNEAMVFSWGDEQRAVTARRIVAALLEAGADPVAETWAGKCVLDRGAFASVDEGAMALVRRRAESELATSRAATRPAFAATRPATAPPLFYGSALAIINDLDPLVVRLRLARGADPNQKDESGSTLVHEAVQWKRLDVQRILLDAGADVNVRNMEGETPLHEACRWDVPGAATILLARGADPYASSMNGMTPANIQPGNGATQLLGPDVLATADDKKGWTMKRANCGVEARLRRERVAWAAGQSPVVRADLWSHGGVAYQVSPSPSALTVTLDGRRYRWSGASKAAAAATVTLAPDDSAGRHSRVQDVRLVLAPADWLGVEDGKAIAWTLGRHKVVAAFNAVDGKGKRVSFETGEAVVEVCD